MTEGFMMKLSADETKNIVKYNTFSPFSEIWEVSSRCPISKNNPRWYGILNNDGLLKLEDSSKSYIILRGLCIWSKRGRTIHSFLSSIPCPICKYSFDLPFHQGREDYVHLHGVWRCNIIDGPSPDSFVEVQKTESSRIMIVGYLKHASMEELGMEKVQELMDFVLHRAVDEGSKVLGHLGNPKEVLFLGEAPETDDGHFRLKFIFDKEYENELPETC